MLPAEKNENLPTTFQYDATADFEDMEHDDLLTPRLAVAQPLTPEVADGVVNQGDIFCRTTSTTIIPRGQRKSIIPLAWWKEYIEWNPDRGDKNNRILNRSTDANSELARACKRRERVINSDGKEVSRVQNTYNVLMLVPEFSWDEMFLMSFARTHYKVWKRMLNLSKSLKHDPDGQGKRQCPLFGAGYELFTELESDGTNKWFEPRFGPPEFLELEHLHQIAPMVTSIRENIEEMKAANKAESDDDSVESTKLDTSAMEGI